MENWIGVAVSIGSGLIFAIVGLPLARGAVAPNTLYGYRTRATLRNQELWYTVNALSGKHLVVTGAMLIALGVIGLGALNDPDQQKGIVLAALVIMFLGITYTLVRGWQVIKEHCGDACDG